MRKAAIRNPQFRGPPPRSLSATSQSRGIALKFTANWPRRPNAAALRALKEELRDRFGPLPPAAELALKATELKLIAAGRNVTAIETKGDKLMLTRNNDFLMVAGKFPRLTRATPSARLNEIKKLLLSL